jgi:small GTP-binding protein
MNSGAAIDFDWISFCTKGQFSEAYDHSMADDRGRKTLKFIVIGTSGVGKTAILKRLVDGTFTTESQSTIGVDFTATVLDVEDQQVHLQIWDTAGQERFRSIAKAYIRSAIGVLLFFDVSSRKSFDDLTLWLNDIHALCGPNAVITLVGNKLDVVDDRKIMSSEGEAFAQLHRLTYLETSARGGDNIEEVFHRTAAAILCKNLSPLAGGTPVTPVQATAQLSCSC